MVISECQGESKAKANHDRKKSASKLLILPSILLLKFASLAKGPIVSGIYNLMKGEGAEPDQIRWDDVIVRQEPFTITTRKPAHKGVLSEREKEVLDEAAQTIDEIRGSIPKWLHKYCPEWTDPGKSSVPIDPSTILQMTTIASTDFWQFFSTSLNVDSSWQTARSPRV
ncbi:MAG TPA: hypothetical protein VI636_02820 [Candidatus Angelobacter sp.]